MRQPLFAVLLLISRCVSAQEAPSAEERIKSLEERLAKIESAPAKVSQSAFNPSIGMAVDGVFRDYNDRGLFSLRAAELNLEAAIDPFAKGWAVITASNQGVVLEEAAAQTTKLPYSLQLTAGRSFMPFGRLSQWHDHELPMVDRPNSINSFVGGEAQADGVLVRWLAPTPFFLEAMAGTMNKLGTDNNRVDNSSIQPLDRWTHLGRLHANFDLTDDVGMDLGASVAWTPKSAVVPAGAAPYTAGDTADSFRTLSGADLTVRYQPASGGLYKGLIWGTEILQNDERGFDPLTLTPQGRVHSYAGYTNIESKVGRQLRLGAFADLTQLPSMPESRRFVTKSFAAYAGWEFTEFNRLRIEYERVVGTFGNRLTGLPGTDFGENDLQAFRPGHIIMLQWTTVLGYHVHGFRGRWGT
jgi:hypothetical protein